MAGLTRRSVLAMLGLGSVLGLGYVVRSVVGPPASRIRLADGHGFMGADPMDMGRYMEMFARHNEISRTVHEIPGGVRTTTESNSPDLAAQLQAHVTSMYSSINQGVEVMCMSPTLPTLFRNASGYRRQLTFTPNGVDVEETAEDPDLTAMIREHAREVTGFVEQGMPAMMRPMMGSHGMMGPGHP